MGIDRSRRAVEHLDIVDQRLGNRDRRVSGSQVRVASILDPVAVGERELIVAAVVTDRERLGVRRRLHEVVKNQRGAVERELGVQHPAVFQAGQVELHELVVAAAAGGTALLEALGDAQELLDPGQERHCGDGSLTGAT
ncbi:MAG TPA: hypothetical protein VML55_16800 [Planctomycetaceae bacterium]|nr:hypothetical protein [Planctomycetaceae bacterium]